MGTNIYQIRGLTLDHVLKIQQQGVFRTAGDGRCQKDHYNSRDVPQWTQGGGKGKGERKRVMKNGTLC